MNFRSLAPALVAAAMMLPAAPAGAQSADPEALSAAQELLDISMTSEVQAAMLNNGWPSIEASVRKSTPTISDQQVAELKSDFAALIDRETKSLMADVPALYTKYFTAQELRDILAFYKTETGKKTLSAMPGLMGEVMQKTMSRMPSMMESIKQSFSRVLAQKGLKL